MIRTIALLAALAVLGACATKPMQYEDDDVIIVKGIVLIKHPDQRTPENIRQVTDHYTKPVLDDAERRALRHLIISNTFDTLTTAAFLQQGCIEGNPIFGKHPNIATIVGAKALMIWWWRHEAAKTPAAFSRARTANVGSAMAYGASAINLRAATNGCVLW